MSPTDAGRVKKNMGSPSVTLMCGGESLIVLDPEFDDRCTIDLIIPPLAAQCLGIRDSGWSVSDQPGGVCVVYDKLVTVRVVDDTGATRAATVVAMAPADEHHCPRRVVIGGPTMDALRMCGTADSDKVIFGRFPPHRS